MCRINQTTNKTKKMTAAATKKNLRLNYACGMNVSSVRKMCTFIFGEYLHEVRINIIDRCFDVYVYKFIGEVSFVEKFEKGYIDYFNEYWGETPGFRIVYYLGENVEDYKSL